MTIDAPDWQRIVTTVQATGDVPDAPDWERIVVGPAGVPIGPGTPVNAWSPYAAAGFLGLTGDPVFYVNTAGHEPGVLGLVMFTALATGTAGHVWAYVTANGALTANENYLCIYDAGQATAGTATKLAQTAAGTCDSPFNTTGMHELALSSGASLVQGQNYFVGVINNGSNAPIFVTQTSPQPIWLNPVGNAYPIRCFSPGPYTSPPGSVAFSSLSTTGNTWLFYVSP